jgi:hypothetical protein
VLCAGLLLFGAGSLSAGLSPEGRGAPADPHAEHGQPAASPDPTPAAQAAHQAAVVPGGHAGHDAGHDVHGAASDAPGALVRGGITREEERAYSLFMHRSCGLALVALGLLIFADRLTERKHGAIRKAMGLVWLLMGAHILINADPMDWPVSGSFMESWSRPGSGEWLQHKTLSLIPMALGLYAILVARRQMEMKAWQGIALAAIMALGGIGLLIHEHEHSPGMDMALIQRQHNLMALTSFFLAAGSVGEGLRQVAWKAKLYLVPVGLILLGLQLAVYTE